MRVLGLKAKKLAAIPPKHRVRILPNKFVVHHEFTNPKEEKTVEKVLKQVEMVMPVEPVEQVEAIVSAEPEKVAAPKKPRTRKPKVVKEATEEVQVENNEEKPEE